MKWSRGWTWDYVRSLPMRRFWKIAEEANRSPTLEELACAWLGIETEPAKKAEINADEMMALREALR